jgi:pimeloyl-ACP methyl ester carboxylesterase
VLFLHGNAGNVSYWVEAATVYRELGWNTLLLDYRGYGRSTGTPTEEGTYSDAEAAWRHLVVTRGIDPSRIVVIGRSLGGGVATWLAERHPVGALVLEATFTSIADVVALAVPLPGIRNFVALGYPSLTRMAALAMPLLVVHGRSDELVPFEHGRALYEAAAGRKEFVELAGGHNDAFVVSRPAYASALRRFGDSLVAR